MIRTSRAQHRSKKTWDKAMVDGRKNLRMDSANPQNMTTSRKTCQIRPILGRGKNALNLIF